MDEEWSKDMIEDDILISATAINPDGRSVQDLFDEGFHDLRRSKGDPDDTSDYHGSTSVSPSSSLSSPSDMKDDSALGLDVSYCMPPFHGNHYSPMGSLNFDSLLGSHHQQQLSPLPPVSQFSQQQHLHPHQQHHHPHHMQPMMQGGNQPHRAPIKHAPHHPMFPQHNGGGEFGIMPKESPPFYNECSLSPSQSDRSSPFDTNLVAQTFANIVYDGGVDAVSAELNYSVAQQQLKSRSKMHEMAVKQRLITDQDPRSQGNVTLSAEEKRTLQQEGYEIPTKLPLTKNQEEALKVVRRKIKNKLSAQESRRKRKQYMDALEVRTGQITDENMSLKNTIEHLKRENDQLRLRLSKYEEVSAPPMKVQKVEPDF